MKVGLKDLVLRKITWRRSSTILTGLLCVSLPSCFAIKGALKSDIKKVKDRLGSKPELKENQYDVNEPLNRGDRGGTLSSLGKRKIVTSVEQLPSEEEIIWAPEDPDAPIAEFEGIEFNDEPIDSWFEDFDKAMRQSRVTGKPVMLWFTRSRNSPLCNVLSRELLGTKEFDEWASENVIRLRIDSSLKISNTGERIDREREIAALKKRFSALGQPVVVMLSPRGSEFGKYRGYDPGSAPLYFGKLRGDLLKAQEDYTSWKADLEAKGYRVWHDARGRTVFAKVARYKEGKLWLVEPDGKRSKTSVNKLSTEDRQYIKRKIEESRSKKTVSNQ